MKILFFLGGLLRVVYLNYIGTEYCIKIEHNRHVQIFNIFYLFVNCTHSIIAWPGLVYKMFAFPAREV